jgi:oxygen-dependent protoporphyrinogen oxidase
MTYFMSFRDGMATLPRACTDYIGKESLRCNVSVIGIEPESKGYAVHLSDGSSIKADAVISAAPSYETAPLIESFDPSMATQLKNIAWSSSATVSMAFHRDDIKAPLKGFGFIVPKRELRRINATTYSSIKFSLRAPDDMLLLRAFIGGGNREDLVGGLDDAAMKTMVLEELDTIATIKAEPALTKIYRWFNGMPKYTVGHLDCMAKLDATLEKHPGLYLVGSSYKGIGIGDCINRAQMAADCALGNLA